MKIELFKFFKTLNILPPESKKDKNLLISLNNMFSSKNIKILVNDDVYSFVVIFVSFFEDNTINLYVNDNTSAYNTRIRIMCDKIEIDGLGTKYHNANIYIDISVPINTLYRKHLSKINRSEFNKDELLCLLLL